MYIIYKVFCYDVEFNVLVLQGHTELDNLQKKSINDFWNQSMIYISFVSQSADVGQHCLIFFSKGWSSVYPTLLVMRKEALYDLSLAFRGPKKLLSWLPLSTSWLFHSVRKLPEQKNKFEHSQNSQQKTEVKTELSASVPEGNPIKIL